MTEYEIEPIPGLPGLPPRGEEIVWQGKPDARMLARTAFHTNRVAAYFGLLALIALASALPHAREGLSAFLGLGMTLGIGAVGVALLHILAWASARSTIYTLTNRRIVLRIGIALPGCINLPLALIGAVDLRAHHDGVGDVAMTLVGPRNLGYVTLWPHARPLRMAAPQPMLRAVADAERVAALVAKACAASAATGATAWQNPVEPMHAAVPAFAQVAA